MSFHSRFALILLLLDTAPALGADYAAAMSADCPNVQLITYTTPGVLLLTGQPFTGPAINLALEELHQEYGYNLTNIFVTRHDLINCDDMVDGTYLVPEYFYHHFTDACFVLLSPGCDDEIPLGRLSTEWNIPILTSGTTYPFFYNPLEFPTMVSFGGVDLLQLRQGLLDVFRYFSWSSVAVIHDLSSANSVYPGLIRLLVKNAVRYTEFTFFPVDTSQNVTIPHEKILGQINRVSRVVLFLVMAQYARAFMLAAERMELAMDDYVFMYAEPFHSIRRFGVVTWEAGDDNDKVVRDAFRSVLQFTGDCAPAFANPEQSVLDRIKMEGIAKYNASYINGEEASEIALSSYYSVKAFGEVLDETFKQRKSLRDGREFANAFANRSFTFNKRNVAIDSSRVRIMNYCIRDMDPENGRMEAVMSYDATSRILRSFHGKKIHWGTPENAPPANEPKCGYLDDKGSCAKNSSSTSSTLVVSIAVPLICAIMVAALWFIHYKSARVDAWWRLQELQLRMRIRSVHVTPFSQRRIPP